MRPMRTIIEEYDWIHTAVGLLGNLLFVVGSVLFLGRSTKELGVWAFIVGSSFMFVGSAGDAGIKVRDKVHGPKGQEGGEGVDG